MDGVKHGESINGCATFAWRDTSDEDIDTGLAFCCVSSALLTVEQTCLASNALTDNPSRFGYEDTHNVGFVLNEGFV